MKPPRADSLTVTFSRLPAAGGVGQLPRGALVREEEHADRDQHHGDGGDVEGPAPGVLLRHALVAEALVDVAHDHDGHAAAAVAPAAGHGVRRAYHIFGEHFTGPELRDDERRAANTDEEAHEAQLGERVDEAREERADAAEGQQGRLDLDRAVDVAQRADHEARDDAGRDVKNVRHPDALFGDVEVLADHNQQRRVGEPDHEGHEETQPLEVERAHVRPRERELVPEDGPELELVDS